MQAFVFQQARGWSSGPWHCLGQCQVMEAGLVQASLQEATPDLAIRVVTAESRDDANRRLDELLRLEARQVA